jgi:hypothetical protein
MNGLKGIAEVAEHLLYEALGLLVPGAAFGLGVAAAAGGGSWDLLLDFVAEHPWLATGGAYVLGYPVQAISRPVVTLFESLLRLPGRMFVGVILWLLPERAGNRVEDWLDAFERWLTRRHAHASASPNSNSVDLRELEEAYWKRRLGLGVGQRLTRRQVQDLSFSALLSERHQLSRFRAAASLARGTAVAVAAAFGVLVVGLFTRAHEPSSLMTLVLFGLAFAFYGLAQRADMYDGLWRDLLAPQLLCNATHDGPLPKREQVTDRPATRPDVTGEHHG